MRVVHSTDDLRDEIRERRIAGHSVGFVPTMGTLHAGQISLIERARAQNGCVVVSSFVNPHAFSTLDEGGDGTRDSDRDLALLENAEVDITFLPDVATLYPPDDSTRVTVERLTSQLEGASRPGHMDGLTTVMLKLIHLVGPARLYMGQRHAQQVVLVRQMLRDLFINLELVVCPTVREDDGLAVSSANALLEHRGAPRRQLPLQCPERGTGGVRRRRALGGGPSLAHDRCDARPSRRPASTTSASPMPTRWPSCSESPGPALALVAVWIGRARLTDNMPLAWDVT